MATRTGDPALDELIEGMVLRAARDPFIARFQEGIPGGCHDANDQFLWGHIRPSGLLKSSGYRFRAISLVSDGSERLWGENGYSWDSYGGYEDRQPGDPNHTFFEVTTPDGDVFTIDFTATQYGYSDWPFVQRRRPDGSWQREPDGVEWRHPEQKPSLDTAYDALSARLPQQSAPSASVRYSDLDR